MSNIMKNPVKTLAIEIFATEPDLSVAQVAERCKIKKETLYEWRRNPNFMEAIYDRYMVKFSGELASVLDATLREAKSGNVQAQRLILEHSGKLVKNVNVTIDSPFEKYLKNVDAIDVEFVDDEKVNEIFQSLPDPEDLPPRNDISPRKKVLDDKRNLERSIKEDKKRQEYNQKQKEWYNWKKRAKKMGVEPLKAKRPTKGQRKAWEQKIIEAEQSNR